MEPCSVFAGFILMLSGFLFMLGCAAWIASEIRHCQIKRIAREYGDAMDAFWTDFDRDLKAHIARAHVVTVDPASKEGRGT